MGAPGEPPVGGIAAVPTGAQAFVFAVAPGHPPARTAEPLTVTQIERHPVAVAADSSRHLEPRAARETGGWRFEAFRGSSRTERLVQDGGRACFAYHRQASRSGFVFSRLRD